MSALREHMRERRLPRELRDSILVHYHHRWRAARVLGGGEALLAPLSAPLRMELALVACARVVAACAPLGAADHLTQRRVAQYLQQQVGEGACVRGGSVAVAARAIW
jgi:hypothetical protein